jgi:hypothetical protein
MYGNKKFHNSIKERLNVTKERKFEKGGKKSPDHDSNPTLENRPVSRLSP